MGSHKTSLSLTIKTKNTTCCLSLPCQDTATSVKPGDPAYSPATVHAPYLSLKAADMKLRCVTKATAEAAT